MFHLPQPSDADSRPRFCPLPAKARCFVRPMTPMPKRTMVLNESEPGVSNASLSQEESSVDENRRTQLHLDFHESSVHFNAPSQNKLPSRKSWHAFKKLCRTKGGKLVLPCLLSRMKKAVVDEVSRLELHFDSLHCGYEGSEHCDAPMQCKQARRRSWHGFPTRLTLRATAT